MWVYAVSIAGKVADDPRYARTRARAACASASLDQLQAAGRCTSALLETRPIQSTHQIGLGPSRSWTALTSMRMGGRRHGYPDDALQARDVDDPRRRRPVRAGGDDAAVVATIPTGTSVATVGESADNVWRLCVAGDPERLLFVQRRQLAPAVPGGDPALIMHVADAFNGVRHLTRPSTTRRSPPSRGRWTSAAPPEDDRRP